jgi:hypothetical protein
VSVNVYATHTHAGLDTLGLWGPAAVDGKNPDYMENLMAAAVRAAEEAYGDRAAGTLCYGSAVPEDLLHDSREPAEYDPAIHQLRFLPADSAKNGIRLLSYSAHAESLRGDNRMLSRDFPGVLSDLMEASCGDRVLFMPGAIGGLIMTRELTEPFDAEANMTATAERLVDAILSIPGLKAVVLETYGSGNAPLSEWFLNRLRRATQEGMVIVNVTQCSAGSVEMERYETGYYLQQVGVVSGYDTTTESAITKLMFLLGHNYAPEEVRRLMQKPIAGEITL